MRHLKTKQPSVIALPTPLQFPNRGWFEVQADRVYALGSGTVTFEAQVLSRLRRMENADRQDEQQCAFDLFKGFRVAASEKDAALFSDLSPALCQMFNPTHNIQAGVDERLALVGYEFSEEGHRHRSFDYVSARLI